MVGVLMIRSVVNVTPFGGEAVRSRVAAHGIIAVPLSTAVFMQQLALGAQARQGGCLVTMLGLPPSHDGRNSDTRIGFRSLLSSRYGIPNMKQPHLNI
jgi:hypothetical protein